uniref:Sialyltransferase-like protein 2 n=1 Tax=Ananas comosus var. bracteatus TaxID=296719 RepID=A0A6V7QD80_ANACO|nr:unnamed protein product [Ananas comosus var. bracteatus]
MVHPYRITQSMLVVRVHFAFLIEDLRRHSIKVAELDETRKEVLIVKTTIHDIMNKMIREVPITNPVYLMLGTSFGSSAKGTGVKALEFALSICDTVDMYGFTVDPGYKEWTRYFSESRQGHTPLQGRAYYQMMECLGLIKIHSPMRADPNRKVDWLPSQSILNAARVASEKLLRIFLSFNLHIFLLFLVLGGGSRKRRPIELLLDHKEARQGKDSSKVRLREPAIKHQNYAKGATLYPVERNSGNGMLCMLPTT